MLALLTGLTMIAVEAPGSLRPGPDNYRAWMAFIQPSPAENSWKGIGWRPEFSAAIAEAKRLGQPILLWTMNGHPLGCT